jgi:hypothetical protein
MQLVDRNTDTAYVLPGTQTAARCAAYHSEAVSSQRLLVILGTGLLAIAGPAVLDTLAQATSASAQVLLEIGRFGLVAYQVFGR